MKSLRKCFAFFCAISLLSGVAYTVNKVNDGFSVREIRSSLTDHPDYAVPFSSDQQKDALQKIVSQPFRYLGKGCQFFAFESQDGNYILKFPKHKHLRPLTWLQKLPLPKRWKATCDEKVIKREARIRNLFSSCLLAYQEMTEETGVLFVHLNRTPALEKKVVLIDKLGISHKILLDEFEFVVQKKALQAPLYFSELLKDNKEALQEKIHQLTCLVQNRCHKGIQDRDRSFVQNVAFTVTQAVFVDIGQFYKDPRLVTSEAMSAEVLHRLKLLRAWAEEKCHELIPYVDHELSEFEV